MNQGQPGGPPAPGTLSFRSAPFRTADGLSTKASDRRVGLDPDREPSNRPRLPPRRVERRAGAVMASEPLRSRSGPVATPCKLAPRPSRSRPSGSTEVEPAGRIDRCLTKAGLDRRSETSALSNIAHGGGPKREARDEAVARGGPIPGLEPSTRFRNTDSVSSAPRISPTGVFHRHRRSRSSR
jgi:hypothetical protein